MYNYRQKHDVWTRMMGKGCIYALILLAAAAFLPGICNTGFAGDTHVWEKVEITLHAGKHYDNPYTEVEVWVDLKGPGFEKRCYGFWDGDNIFKVRVLAVAPGLWKWSSGSNQTDTGLNG